MARKKMKPRIPPGKAREWLEKVESGVPIKEISDDEYYDPRTIKKYIREAQQRREAHQARASVLRNALERHYKDFYNLAVKIEEMVKSGSDVTLDVTNPYMWKALRQHKAKSPLWDHIKRWNNLLKDTESLRQDAYTKIGEYLNKAAKKEGAFQYKGVLLGTIALFEHQFDQWLMGGEGLNLKENFKVESIDDQYSNLSCGFSQMGKVKNDDINEIENTIIDYRSKIKSWGILKDSQRLYTELQPEIRNKISDELAIIKLKRVIPGHCDYCPA
ncbi:hypothetical protein ACFLYB_01545 [Chloroflexota bacterium]